MDKSIKSLIYKLPERISSELIDIFNNNIVTELRLRAGFRPKAVVDGVDIPISDYILTDNDIHVTFDKLCDYTLSAYENQLKYGFLTTGGGHRIGIGAEYYFDGYKYLPGKVTSLTIRIANINCDGWDIEIPGFKKGLLIIGPPHSGKTTLLKKICNIMNNLNITVCDERGELYSPYAECDFLSGINKVQALQQAVRTMNPDIVICDEIGDEGESRRILSGVNSGVKFICTAHGDCLDSARQKPNINILLKANVFDKIIILSGKKGEFGISEIADV